MRTLCTFSVSTRCDARCVAKHPRIDDACSLGKKLVREADSALRSHPFLKDDMSGHAKPYSLEVSGGAVMAGGSSLCALHVRCMRLALQ